MIRILILSFFTSFLSAQQNELIQYPVNSNIEILYAGDYKQGELDVKILNREWWGLYKKDNISYVRKVELRLDKLDPDIQYDWEYRVSVDDNKNCIILFTGLDLTEREIKQHLSDYADLGLGIKIRDCVKETGSCSFDAEY